jgi:hypothetical protein
MGFQAIMSLEEGEGKSRRETLGGKKYKYYFRWGFACSYAYVFLLQSVTKGAPSAFLHLQNY